jgi:hypothetical protein
MRKFSELVGKTLTYVDKVGDEKLVFTTNEGEVYTLYHERECCEDVWIEDICGDLDDLLDAPIRVAEKTSNHDGEPLYSEDSFTWTFYKLDTAKGGVTIRWYGQSNGYYSESVTFEKAAG